MRVLAFALTSLLVLIHAGAAWGDIQRVQRLAESGWLGFEDDPATPIAFAERLWDTLGLLALVGAAAVAIALWKRTWQDLVLLSFVAVYALSLLPVEAHYDRYVLPFVPVLCVLAGRDRWLATAAVVTALVPLWWSVDDGRALTGHDLRIDAAAWIERNVPPGDRIAATRRRCRSTRRTSFASSFRGLGDSSTSAATSPSLRAGFRCSSSATASATACSAAASYYPREVRFYRLPTALQPAFEARADGHDRWVRVYRIYLSRWSAAGESTGHRARDRGVPLARRCSVSRSRRAACWRRRSAARSTSGAH